MLYSLPILPFYSIRRVESFSNVSRMHCALVLGLEGGSFYFNTVREGEHVVFATSDEAERTLWVQAIYRATGQSFKPVPPVSQPMKTNNIQLSKAQGGMSNH
jgi:hypothetical protein